jgi:hypothetical protein
MNFSLDSPFIEQVIAARRLDSAPLKHLAKDQVECLRSARLNSSVGSLRTRAKKNKATGTSEGCQQRTARGGCG